MNSNPWMDARETLNQEAPLEVGGIPPARWLFVEKQQKCCLIINAADAQIFYPLRGEHDRLSLLTQSGTMKRAFHLLSIECIPTPCCLPVGCGGGHQCYGPVSGGCWPIDAHLPIESMRRSSDKVQPCTRRSITPVLSFK